MRMREVSEVLAKVFATVKASRSIGFFPGPPRNSTSGSWPKVIAWSITLTRCPVVFSRALFTPCKNK